MHDKILYRLTWLALAMSLGHHLDHLIPGTRLAGRSPTRSTPSPSAWSSTRSSPPAWCCTGPAGSGLASALVSGGGAVFVSAVHFGPAAVEPPELILDHYQPPILGWLAWLAGRL